MLNLAEKKKAALTTLANLSRQHDAVPAAPAAKSETTLVSAFIGQLAELGVEQAFGISGGAIALLFDALAESPIELHHFRHETGAAFAATEAYFAGGSPTMVFATTGPGVLNALTGITAARWDGAKVILVSGATSAPQRGRWATQETSSYTFTQDALYTKGAIFDLAVRIEHPSEFPEVMRRLSAGLARPGGFVAHICLPMSLQSKRIDQPPRRRMLTMAAPAADPEDVTYCAELLKEGTFAIWAGFGATDAAPWIRKLAEATKAKVFCSPRGKGILPEDHPLFLGVTGLGGHATVTDYMTRERPDRVLVIGTRLGEATSFWDQEMVPKEGFIHVDVDPEVPGTAYPESPTVGVHAEATSFLRALCGHFPPRPEAVQPEAAPPISAPRRADRSILRLVGRSPVRPQAVMEAIQRRVIDASDAVVLAECGNSFAWCNHHLRFPTPGRYRVSTLFGSMGHAASGVVGAALARGGKAVAVVGDGSMLMNSELSTAASYGAGAVWIVLNDAGYGMCRDGQNALGLSAEGVDFPRVDFVGLARSVGADGVAVDSEDQLEAAVKRAMAADGPFVIDVRVDASETSPLLKRFESLIQQGSSKNVAGWEA